MLFNNLNMNSIIAMQLNKNNYPVPQNIIGSLPMPFFQLQNPIYHHVSKTNYNLLQHLEQQHEQHKQQQQQQILKFYQQQQLAAFIYFQVKK